MPEMYLAKEALYIPDCESCYFHIWQGNNSADGDDELVCEHPSFAQSLDAQNIVPNENVIMRQVPDWCPLKTTPVVLVYKETGHGHTEYTGAENCIVCRHCGRLTNKASCGNCGLEND